MKNSVVKRAIIVILLVLLCSSIAIIPSSIKHKVVLNNMIVYTVYAKLLVNSGTRDIPPLTILDSDVANAWTDGQSIVITTSMIAIIENEDQLSMVLAHEMAHYINHDVYHDDLDQRDVEAHADKLGAFIMMRAGFNICEGKKVFAVFKRLFGDTATPVTHPDFGYRLDQLNLPQCNNHG